MSPSSTKCYFSLFLPKFVNMARFIGALAFAMSCVIAAHAQSAPLPLDQCRAAFCAPFR
jgi:hypothetical protein